MRIDLPALALTGLAFVSACGLEGDGKVPVSSARAAVVFGEQASRANIRGTVALVDAAQGFTFCTGTLIAPEVVMTAAHCLVTFDENGAITGDRAPGEILVVAGVTSISQATRDDVTEVAEALHHPRFATTGPDDRVTGLGNLDDVGVLLLSTAIDTLTPVPVLSPDQVPNAMVEGATLIVEGFGTSDIDGTSGSGILRLAEVPLVTLGDDEFIAGRDGTPDACPGDSGGPVYLEYEGETYVVGVTSRSLANATQRCGQGGIYTLAPAHADFLESSAPVSIDDSPGEPTVEADGDDQVTGGDQGDGDEPTDSASDPVGAADEDEDEGDASGDGQSVPVTGPRTAVGGCSAAHPGRPPHAFIALVLFGLLPLARRRR